LDIGLCFGRWTSFTLSFRHFVPSFT